MRNTSALHLVLLAALLGSCSSRTTQPDDNAKETRTQEETVAVNATAVLAGHTDRVWHAEFSPDGSRIVTASLDHTARLWDSDGKQLAVLVGNTAELRRAGTQIRPT